MKSQAQARLDLIVEHLASQGLSGAILASNGQNSFLDSNAVYVASGFRPIAESALVVNRNGDATLVITPAWDANRARAQSCISTVLGTDDLAAGVAEVASRNGLDLGSSISVGLSILGRGVVERMSRLLGCLPRTTDDLARDISRIRTADELKAARHATWIAEQGYERLLKSARPGLREFELAADIFCHMKELGGEDNFLLMSASQHNLAVRAAGQRVLEDGDIILAEITPCYRGQFVQICRTAVIGEPRPIVADKFALLQDAMRRGQEAATPGARVSAVTAALNAPIQAAGYGQYCAPPYMRVRGHGLGITSSRPGDIDSGNDTQLEDGMVFVMHPNQYIPESGYLLCGETVVVSAGGAISLSAKQAQLDVIGI